MTRLDFFDIYFSKDYEKRYKEMQFQILKTWRILKLLMVCYWEIGHCLNTFNIFSIFHFQLIKSVKLETVYEHIKARLKHGFQPYIFSSS